MSSKKEDCFVMLGDDIASRCEENEDDKIFCKPGWIHCSPGTGGGCCPPRFPVCCGNGVHCRPMGSGPC